MSSFFHRWLAPRAADAQKFSAARSASDSRLSPSHATCSAPRGPRPSFDADHAVHCGGICAPGVSAEIALVAQRFGVSQKALRALNLEFSHSWGEPGRERSLAVFSRNNSLYFLFGDARDAESQDDAPGLQPASASNLLSRFSHGPVAEPLAAALAPFAPKAIV